MNFSSLQSRRPRLSAGFRIAALLVVLMVGLVATISSSADEIPPSAYSVSVSPTPATCEESVGCTLTFTFTNVSPDSAALLTDASITAPGGFTVDAAGPVTVTSASPLVTKTWSPDVDGNVVLLSADDPDLRNGLAPSEKITVPVTVTASLSSLGPGHVFATEASGFLLPATDPVAFSPTGPDPSVTVVNDQVNCAERDDCETEPITLNNTTAKAEAPVGQTQQFLTLSVGGSFLDESSRCRTIITPKAGWEPVTTNLTDPPERSHTVTLTLARTVDNSPGAPGAERIQICAVSDSPFITKEDNNGDGQPDPAMKNEKTGMFEGLLPDCPPFRVTKCVMSRTRSAGKTVITYFVEPGDPISIPGLEGGI